ncbi:MAG: HWE histidine kinase domain-containing protein [Balneolales bacterium]
MTDKSSREVELEKRLKEAEETLDALRNHKVDAVIGTNQVALLRLKQVEDQLKDQIQISGNRLKEIETIYQNVPVGLCVLDRNLRFSRVNDHLARMNEIPVEEHLGQPMRELLPGFFENVKADLYRVIETNKPLLNIEVSGQTPARPGVERHWLAHCLPLLNQQGHMVGINMVIEEITERKKAEQTQRLLLGELNHRIKNNIATIQAIADQTLQQSENPEEFVDSFKGRLHILARSHTLLTRSKWEGAYVEDILNKQLILNEKNDRVEYFGPKIFLSSQTALHLALVLHELGTNASKHGALSAPSGRLNVRWRIRTTNNGTDMQLDWVEQGGPPVEAVRQRGFGMTLIEQSLITVGGETRLHFNPSGLHCEITLPLSDDQNHNENHIGSQ